MIADIGSVIKSQATLYNDKNLTLCKKGDRGFIFEILPDDSWYIIFQSGMGELFTNEFEKNQLLKLTDQKIPTSTFQNKKLEQLQSIIKNNHFLPMKRKRL